MGHGGGSGSGTAGNGGAGGGRGYPYGSIEPRDSFAIAIDEQSDGADGHGNNLGGILETDVDMTDDEELNSKPSSRRSSNLSLDDVCFPVDSSHEREDSLGPHKMWPDLEVLQEFAAEEARELAASGRDRDDDDEYGSPFSLVGQGEQPRYSVNETSGGRLRPHRPMPWGSTTAKRGHHGGRPPVLRADGTLGDGAAPLMDDRSAAQYRFTYFREDMEATIHSPTISGLLPANQSFADLFPPRSDRDRGTPSPPSATGRETTPDSVTIGPGGGVPMAPQAPGTAAGPTASTTSTTTATTVNKNGNTQMHPLRKTVSATSAGGAPAGPMPDDASTRGDGIVPFWLDVLNPTEEEMKVLSKTFGIHPLTTEDIFLGETREKVELFRHYYLVCFSSFDSNFEKRERRERERDKERGGAGGTGLDKDTRDHGSKRSKTANGNVYQELPTTDIRRRRGSEVVSRSSRHRNARRNELRPLRMYIIVFHEGVLSFHFAPTPHTVNVRRRARLLRDYLNVSSDWISYALIDDITDGFAPIIESIEEDVNAIEDAILRMHSGDASDSDDSDDDDSSSSSTVVSSNQQEWREKGDMLRRIGECRRRVMSVLSLLGNKADVIRGFAKRCNEQWAVAPRNEIGLYLGDIQDHIVTMVQSLNHYEKLLARSHSNYLAQINIDMTKTNNDMNDVLSRITVLGTIVLPMNIVTGLWGMNVPVPGQETTGLAWFLSICVTLFIFGVICYYVTKRIYKVI